MPFLTSAAGRFCYFNTSGQSGTEYRFDVTGMDQYWTVPAGVYSVTVQLYGANGGAYGTTEGGLGGYVSGTLSVTPADIYTLVVGAAGDSIYFPYGDGGVGTSLGNGGGRTAIIFESVEIVTAGAGGGAADGTFAGGNGGGSVGQTPSYGDGRDGTAPTGGSTDDSVGGTGGTYIYATSNGLNGRQYAGGNGGDPYGGGGGSGYYGGGGGGSALQPGAGGSSYTGGLTGTIVSTQGVGGDVTTGEGYIIITVPN